MTLVFPGKLNRYRAFLVSQGKESCQLRWKSLFPMTLSELGNSGQRSLPTQQNLKQVVEKICFQAGQKDLRGEAREIATSGGTLERGD